jgi:hypothetical protein
MSSPLMIDCPACGKTYDYSETEEAFWQQELPPHRLNIPMGSLRPSFLTILLSK